MKYNSQNMFANTEKIFKMANGQEATYKFGEIQVKWSVSKKIECNECEHCAPNTADNRVNIFFQEGDIGLCFYDPKKVSIINPTFKKEMNCLRIRQIEK